MEIEAAKAIGRRHGTVERHMDEVQIPGVEKKENGNLLDYILGSRLPEQEKTKYRMGQEAFSIYAAGGETIARTLATATYHLLSNPDVLERLRIELKEVKCGPKLEIDIRFLENLPWLV